MKYAPRTLLLSVALTLLCSVQGGADTCILFYTPKGTLITTAYQMTWELSSAEIASMNGYVATRYPKATRETNASRKYNCHSYAWNSQSSSNSIWIDNPDKYWLDKSYLKITSSTGAIPSNVPDGSKVSYTYTSNLHSAIKVSSTQFRSKWGAYPRMLHAPCYSPYSCSGLSFYKKNF